MHSSAADIIRVRHMLDAALETLSFIEGKTRKSLDKNRVLSLALIKQLELIGEAASKVSPEFRAQFAMVPWAIIIATRNRLIHGYFDIDLDVVWKTIDKDLRELAKILTEVLAHKTFKA